jgi:phospholipase C
MARLTGSIGQLLSAGLLLIAACTDNDDHRPPAPTATNSPTTGPLATATATPSAQPTPPGFANLQHIIIVMQENHSFDNYFGVLPYAADSPYHAPPTPGAPCPVDDSLCVDGLICAGTTPQSCANANFTGEDAAVVQAFHETTYCLDAPAHQWLCMHQDQNLCNPNSTTVLGDGFVVVNASPNPMGYYNEVDLPYYYALASTFALSDRHFASLVGPTLPNRMYSMAATSFGHLLTDSVDSQPPGPPGYQPITGTIFDLLDDAGHEWREYYECGDNAVPPRPYAQMFRYADVPNYVPLSQFQADTTGTTCRLPAVSYISLFNHEHGNFDIRAGQYDVSVLINSLMTGPCWASAALFVTYDEGGGFYDHVATPLAVSPDGIPPGACADLSNPPLSKTPGAGANCSASADSQAELVSMVFPGEAAADFTQYGFRIPLLAVSPFAKPQYVSHVVSDHTSLLRLIEDRFTPGRHLTARDARAHNLTDLFDFTTSPSLHATVSPPLAPTPGPGDGGCTFPLPSPAPSCVVPMAVPTGPTPTREPTPPPATPSCPIPRPAPAS